jgi:broad specificity phosphatase PhoE
MQTVLYLIRHAATDANLARPARLQGRLHNPPLAVLGIRQAEMTRDFLAVRSLQHCYCSPLARAVQTASIIAAPHGLTPQPLDDLIECDVGNWEGLDWQTIREKDPAGYDQFMRNPAEFGYRGGESFADVHRRVSPCLEKLLVDHAGQSMLVVAHHAVNRTYLAGLLGLTPGQARHVTLDNCGISVVARDGDKTTVSMLNASFHLQGIAA